MYQYKKDRSNVQIGDVLEARHSTGISITQGKLYIVQSVSSTGSLPIIIQDDGAKGTHSTFDFNNVETRQGSEAKVGDTCIRAVSSTSTATIPEGGTFVINSTSSYNVTAKVGDRIIGQDFCSIKVLVKEDLSSIPFPEVETKINVGTPTRDSAYYKYFQRLHDKKVPLERNALNSTWGIVPDHMKLLTTYDNTLNGTLELRLKDRFLDEPEVGTKGYYDYWQEKSLTHNIHFYQGSGAPCGMRGLSVEDIIKQYKFRVFFLEEKPALLHQEWKDLYDSGVELEWATTDIPDLWEPLTEHTYKCNRVTDFKFERYMYRRMAIKVETPLVYPFYKAISDGSIVKFTSATKSEWIKESKVVHLQSYSEMEKKYELQDWTPVETPTPNLCQEVAMPGTHKIPTEHSIATMYYDTTKKEKVHWLDLASDISMYIEDNRTYPSIREAGSMISEHGVEIINDTISDFIKYNPQVMLPVPSYVLEQCCEHKDEYSDAMVNLTSSIKRYTKKEEPMKNPFKIGDTVRVLNSGSKRVAGHIHTVLKIVDSNVEYLKYYSAHFENFELVTEQDDCASATTETSEPTTIKEEIMSTIENTVEVSDQRAQPKTLQQVIEEMFGPQNATDLANKPQYVAHVFNEEEALTEIIAVDSNEAVVKMLQKNPRYYLGYVISVYKLFDTHELAVPVSSERASKPVKKSKKK